MSRGSLTGQPLPNALNSNFIWGIAASNIQPNFGDNISSTSAEGRTNITRAHGVQYDIDPSAAVNLQCVPSAAFAQVSIPDEDNEELAMAASLAPSFSLEQNYPNPFNPTTQIRFSLPRDGHASLKIYSLLGQEIATLFSGNLTAGTHFAEWNASRVASGTYLVRLVSEGSVQTRKVTVLK